MSKRNNHNNVTVPAIPAAIKRDKEPKSLRLTLIIKMPVDVKEEREKGRYSIIAPPMPEVE